MEIQNSIVLHGLFKNYQTEKKNNIGGPFFIARSSWFDCRMLKHGRRLAIVNKSVKAKNAIITFYDIFHEEKKEVEIPLGKANLGILWANMIDDEYLLIGTHELLFAFKIDRSLWKARFVAKTDLTLESSSILINQSNIRNFVIYNRRGFIIGTLKDDRIFLSEAESSNFGGLAWSKLIGNHLICIQIPQRVEYETPHLFEVKKIDLTKVKEFIPWEDWKREDIEVENFKVTFKLDVNYFMPSFSKSVYCWSENRLYIMLYEAEAGRSNEKRIFEFDCDTLILTNIGIKVYGSIYSMFVDEKHFMTLETKAHGDYEKSSFYRLALKKPDSLNNIVWFAIRSHAVLFNRKAYEYIHLRLPEGSDLKSILI